MGKWEGTHEALIRAALELFTENGYDATSTVQIAQRAGVSEMTLFRHFPSKELLVVSDPFDPLIADAVRARPGDEPPMRALAEGVRQTWAEVDAETIAALRDRLRITIGSTGLRGAVERNSDATVGALADALVDRGVADVTARVAATAAIAGLSIALLEWARSDGAALDESLGLALDVLGGGRDA